jgi:hypothetical protein
MRFVICTLLVCSLCSCADGSEETIFNTGQSSYHIPAAHVLSLTREPDQVITLSAPEDRFELVYDSRTVGRQDRYGWPTITSVNDRNTSRIERHAVRDLKVVCRRAPNQRGKCGFKVVHGGADWAVRIAAGRMSEVTAIHEKAIAILDSYRPDSSSR